MQGGVFMASITSVGNSSGHAQSQKLQGTHTAGIQQKKHHYEQQAQHTQKPDSVQLGTQKKTQSATYQNPRLGKNK